MDPMDPETVIRHYAPTVYRLAAAQLHSRHDADDVLQEVFLRYLRKQPTFDSEEHRALTGVSNETVLSNALWLAEHKKLYEVRTVIAPDLYDTERSIRRTGEFLAPYLAVHPFRIKVIAYRPMGVRREYADCRVPDPKYLEKMADILRSCGFQDIIII